MNLWIAGFSIAAAVFGISDILVRVLGPERVIDGGGSDDAANRRADQISEIKASSLTACAAVCALVAGCLALLTA